MAKMRHNRSPMMESAWTRGTEFPERSLDEIRVALANRKVERVERIAEGRANAVYRVWFDNSPAAVLRFHETGTAVLERTLAASLPTEAHMPRILDAGADWTLMEACVGSTIESLAVRGDWQSIMDSAEDLGRTLAVISRIQFSEAGFLNPNDLSISHSWTSAYDGLMDYARSLLERVPLPREVVATIQRIIDEAEPWMRESLGPPCLTHGDFKASNLMIHEGRVTGVLDWEFAFAGPVLFSFAQLLRFEHQLPVRFGECVLRGFDKPMPARWRETALILDFVSLLDFLCRPDCSESVRVGVTELLERSLSRLA